MKNSELIQNIGENLGFQSKNFMKSHDLTIRIQFSLLILPLLLSIISFYLSGNKLLDYLSFTFSILALAYYAYFGKYSELYMSWGEKYLIAYKNAEDIFKREGQVTDKHIEELKEVQEGFCKDTNKPTIHPLAKRWVDKTIEEEMKYGNEDVVWWKK